MRLGVVPYLNSVPLIHGIACEIYKAPPAKLGQLAEAEDIILAPIVVPFLDPSWHLLEGVGIGSFGPVETVKLFFNNGNSTIENIKTIYSDEESLTSQALLKIFLQFYWKTPSEQIEWTKERENSDAFLLIGDKVWEQKVQQPGLDLGQIWTEWTGFPFVFACWMTKNKKVGQDWQSKLTSQAEANLKNLEPLAANLPPEKRTRALAYWRQLNYRLGDQEKAGIECFQKYWAELNHHPRLPLKWI